MNTTVINVCQSAIDKDRFGIESARASSVTLDTIEPILEFCNKHQVRFLIARCDAEDIKAAQAMEAKGFLLMDTLLHYRCSLVPTFLINRKPMIRSLRPGEEETVRAIAIRAFNGYVGHYHADERLDRKLCDEAYASWAYRSSLQKEVADEVLVAEMGDTLGGFITLKMNRSSVEANMILSAVHPDAQGSGIYSSLVSAAKEWSFRNGADTLATSTHLPNRAVQKVWTRQGFQLTHAEYTFHKWFEP